MRHLVLGTAGHIDHGKSALVLALTGTDPDRLKEEKRRGITIELGFADMELDEGHVVSFVDVPGHERFVKHMVAGAMGIDAVMLVVAADQGVQPQTREHLDICRLLGVRRGVVALTKCDLVDGDLQDVVALELRELLEGTFLDGAPILPVSAREGRGLEPLRAALAELFDAVPPRSAAGIPRLGVDRSFVLRGFGTVVTGTLVSGRLHEGDEVEILPEGRRARIRGLQVHHHAQPVARAGQRTAVNLQGIDCDEVPRGSTLTRPGALTTVRRAWARLTLLPHTPKPLRRGGPVRFHQGTFDVPARLRVLGGDGEGLHAELHFGEPTVLAPGDRFILRRPAPVDTVGGGVIVDTRPPRPKEAADERFVDAALEPVAALAERLERAGVAGREPASLGPELGLTGEQLQEAMRELVDAGRAVIAASRWVHRPAWDGVARRAVELVSAYHGQHPLEPGMPREGLRVRACKELAQDAWREMLAELESRGELKLAGEVAASVDHRVELDDAEQRLARRISDRLREAGLDPPAIDELIDAAERKRASPIVELLIGRGELVRIEQKRLFHAEALSALRERLVEYAKTSRRIDVAGFKELAGVTRKNAIPLLEYLDGERVTRRVGNHREILV